MEREKFGTRLGFILVSAGCAIGLGNVWRFPYITGEYGGAAFVIMYLVFLAIFALPALIMEFAAGRASQRSIGASKGDISRVFNAETIIVGFTAGVIGIGLTALACIPANAIVYSLFDVRNVAILPWQAAVVLVGISMLLTFLAGLIPSSAASRKDPVEALRSE